MHLVLRLLLAGVLLPALQQPATERTQTLRYWEELGYGMFIHFGLATFTDDELGLKGGKAEDYRPTRLDVEQWVRTAREAGMRYAVLTAKHCTGHCLWPSKVSDFTVAQSPVETDVVRSFVEACRKQGIRPGLYYLLGWDMRHQPRMSPQQYEQFCAAQITELLSSYGPLVELWLDIPFDMGPDTAGALRRLYSLAKRLQPDCLVMLNQGFTDGTAIAAYPATYQRSAAGPPTPMWPRDLIGGERTLPPPGGHNPRISHDGTTYYIPMEVCDTLEENWFWSADDAPRPVRLLYAQYKACRERGANLLLDVAPDKTGRIPEESVRALRALAACIRDPRRVPASVTAGRPASASGIYRGDPAYGADRAVDDDHASRWATDSGTTTAWLEVDMGTEHTLHGAYVREGWNRIRRFAIEVPDASGGWRQVYCGGRVGNAIEVRFKPVRASRVRLHILEATDGPTIYDFEVYGKRA